MTNRRPTIHEIKRSVEYRWRMKQTQVFFCLCGFLIVFLTTVGLVAAFRDGFSSRAVQNLCGTFASVLLVGGLLLGVPGFYYFRKARYLLKNRDRLLPCTTILNAPVLMKTTRGVAWYCYEVDAFLETEVIATRTTIIFRHFDLEKYTGSRVTALYDSDADCIYILNKTEGENP